jgi:hypothetical protein
MKGLGGIDKTLLLKRQHFGFHLRPLWLRD